MPSKSFVLNLSKLMIAAAWADGEMDSSEINALKDLLFSFPQLSEKEWTVLNMYIDAPVGPEETEHIMKEVVSEIDSESDKTFIKEALSRHLESDGKVTDEENVLFEQIIEEVEGKETGLLSKLGRVVGIAIRNRSGQYSAGTHRDERIDDYLKNTIYFKLVTELEASGDGIELDDDQIRKLCLCAGLMARIAWVDETITEDEKKAIRGILTRNWNIPTEEARLITGISCASVAKDLDFYRLTRSYFECTSVEERREFMKILFQVANSCGRTEHREIEEIRTIANALHLTHKDFIDAKLSIPDEDRGNL
ncbi:TerB family tellurite resistance protein [candidate division KSB1 bacterium]